MARFSIPYLKPRGGRPRWEPGPRLRAAGFKGRDLKDEQGRWMSLDQAIAAAQELNAEVDEWRRAGQPRRRPRRMAKQARSVRHLAEAWQKSPKYMKLRAITRRDYTCKLNVFLDEFGDHPIAAIERHHLYSWWQELHGARGHAMANSIIAVARSMLSHAGRIGWRSDNPARELGLETVAPRCVVWTPEEAAALVTAADDMGLHAIADAVVIALHTGQRQGDVLGLELPEIANGRSIWRQSKRNARVSVPFTEPLAARIAQIRERRASITVVDIRLARLVVLDPNGLSFTRERFGKYFRMAKARAAKAVPSISDKLFLDLRDTAITRLALAGCTVPEIRSITGHSMQTIHQVLAHYLAIDPRMADTAIDRLRSWMQEEGIKV